MQNQRIFTILLCLFAYSAYGFQAPANDACVNASAVIIPNGGFALGVFSSEIVNMSGATLEPGESIPANVAPPDPAGSVWFEFSLPTSRAIQVDFSRTSGSASAKVAMAIYKGGSCPPAPADLFTDLLPINNYGNMLNACIGPGRYLVQVIASLPTTETVYLTLTVSESQTANVPVYDLPVEARDFGLVSGSPTASHKIECHSIDGPEEYNCLPVANPARYNKSTWYVFRVHAQTTDLLRIRAVANGLPDTIGYRLFEGDCRITQPFNLPVLYDCTILRKYSASGRGIEHPCELKANTTYSFQLVFPEDYNSGTTNVAIWVEARGALSTAAPRPLINQMPAPDNRLGVLPQNPDAGITTKFSDKFSCNGRMALNDCGAVNPAAGVDFNSRHFDIATFATFELAGPANLALAFQTTFSNNEYPLVRLFAGAPTDDCHTLNPASDLVLQFQQQSAQARCLPAGQYTLQVLGSTAATMQNPANAFYENGWEYGHLGLPFTLNLTAQTAKAQTDFSLSAPGDADRINNEQALAPYQLYTAQPGKFGCDNTVLPENAVCFNRRKMMVREWVIGDGPGGQPDSGAVMLYDLNVHYTPGNINNPPSIRYRLFGSSLHTMANAQNAHNAGEFITGAQTIGNCLVSSSTSSPIDSFCFCAVRDTYALAGFGDSIQINYGDQPRVMFQTPQTKFYNRFAPENMGDITATGVHVSQTDYFSCLNNPFLLGGQTPCLPATKLLYREFYLDEPRTLVIGNAPDAAGRLRLFSGRASDPSAALALLVNCFNVFDDTCMLFQPGWYTLVAYGNGPGYDNPIYNNGAKGDVGKPSQVFITVKTIASAKYNRPWKAYNAGITDWKTALANDPYAETDSLYTLGAETWGCLPDLPFDQHPIQPCSAGENRFAYYVFVLTEPAFVSIQGIPKQYHTEVFAFDVRADSARLLTDQPVYPCAAIDKRQLCNLPPGVYTLVIFGTDADARKSVTPKLYVERGGFSRFDHAARAYDFGIVPGDGQWYNGKPGDTHPSVPGLAPSYDVFYCSTGAQTTDPPEGIPFSGVGHNPNIYNPVYPHVLFTSTVPTPTLGTQKESWRNLWMTLVLTGSGEIEFRLDLPAHSADYPALALYESDVDGSIPFAQLQNFGGIDSTLANGLTLREKNFNTGGSGHTKMFTYQKLGCLRDTVRYYLVLTMNNRTALPNVPVALSVKYQSQTTVAAPYDLFNMANEINGLQETEPPYTPVALGPGTYQAAPFVLNCATRSPDDPYLNPCYDRSVWYKLVVAATGKLRFALEKNLDPATLDNYPFGTHLYRENTPGDIGSLKEISTTTFHKSNQQNTTGFDWEQACVSPGVYYLFFENCFGPPSGFDIYTTYRPVVWIEESPGDFCATALNVDITTPGVYSASADVECHSMGGDYGENGPNLGCLNGPTGYKSSWFKITVTGDERLDVTFQLETPAGVNADQLGFRLLYGACDFMTPGPCNSNGNTIFTLNCLTAGDYYVQLISPLALNKPIGLKLTSVPSPDQNCIPVNPVVPSAGFTYTSSCSTVQLHNTSTIGPDIQYTWILPDGQTSMDHEPTFYPTAAGTYTITLIVRNTVFQLADTLTQTILVEDPTLAVNLSDTLLCAGNSVLLDASLNGATYLWQDGSTLPTREVATGGLYWVEISADGCTRRDTAIVEILHAEAYLNETLCPGESLSVGGEVFDAARPSGTVILSQAGFMGCDSTVTVQVTFSSNDTTNLQQTTCNPAGVGTFAQSLTNQFGCDSTVVTVVSFEPGFVDTTTLHSATCDPALAGVSQLMLTGADGCDSLVITITILLPSDTIYRQETTCNPASAGTYVQSATNQFGCDSTVVTVVLFNPGLLDTTLVQQTSCDSSQVGTVQTLLTGVDGCDSLVITITAWSASNCPPAIVFTTDSLSCAGIPDGVLFLSAGGGLSPYTYFWSGAGLNGTGQITADGDIALLDNMPAGAYSVTVTGQNGLSTVASLTLAAPPLLIAQAGAVLIAGPYALRCAGDTDAALHGVATGGTPPYLYVWNLPGQTGPTVNGVGAGVYTLSVSDARQCSASAIATVLAPPPLELDLDFPNPSCGANAVEALIFPEGGAPPYTLQVNGLAQTGFTASFTDGQQVVQIIDANGCTADTLVTTILPPAPEITLPTDTIIALGEPLTIVASTNLLSWDTIIWRPLPDPDCPGCLQQDWVPTAPVQQYTVTIVDHYGCTAQAGIWVRVNAELPVYVPNAFKPGGSAGNDLFTISTGPAVEHLLTARIYDRWGSLIYDWNAPVTPALWPGWNGKTGDLPAAPGVYVYYLRMKLKDGSETVVRGDVTLLR